MNAPLIGLADTLDSWLLLRRRETAAKSLPEDRRRVALTLHAAGDTRLDAALGERGAAALLLARAAIACFVEAAVAARSPDLLPAGATLEELWHQYESLAAASLLPVIPAELAPARDHSATKEPPEEEIAAHGEGRIDETLALAAFVSGAVEVRTATSIRMERALRIGGAVVLAILAIAAIRVAAPRPPNRALHANVTASSRRPSSGPPLDVTNGKVVPEAGLVTNDEADTWVQVDLGQVFSVSEITVVGSDEHQDDVVPMRTETSLDEKAWEPAAVQKTPFSVSAPAVLKFSGRKARYVRLHGRPGGAMYLHEIEIR